MRALIVIPTRRANESYSRPNALRSANASNHMRATSQTMYVYASWCVTYIDKISSQLLYSSRLVLQAALPKSLTLMIEADLRRRRSRGRLFPCDAVGVADRALAALHPRPSFRGVNGPLYDHRTAFLFPSEIPPILPSVSIYTPPKSGRSLFYLHCK